MKEKKEKKKSGKQTRASQQSNKEESYKEIGKEQRIRQKGHVMM